MMDLSCRDLVPSPDLQSEREAFVIVSWEGPKIVEMESRQNLEVVYTAQIL